MADARAIFVRALGKSGNWKLFPCFTFYHFCCEIWHYWRYPAAVPIPPLPKGRSFPEVFMNINIDIEKLVFERMARPPSQRWLLQAPVEAELGRLLAKEEIPDKWKTGGVVPSGAIQLKLGTNFTQMGQQIAREINLVYVETRSFSSSGSRWFFTHKRSPISKGLELISCSNKWTRSISSVEDW